jgi:hypothetical protein
MTLEEPPKFSGVHSVAAEALLYLKKARSTFFPHMLPFQQGYLFSPLEI